jgi:hypothetical protein
MDDDVIEIPDSAGLSDMTRDAIFNVWANDGPADDEGFDEQVHYLRVLSLFLNNNNRTANQHNTNNVMPSST